MSSAASSGVKRGRSRSRSGGPKSGQSKGKYRKATRPGKARAQNRLMVPEKKCVDFTFGTAAGTAATTTMAVYDLTAIAQGNDVASRTGNSLALKSVQIRLAAWVADWLGTSGGAAQPTPALRYWILMDLLPLAGTMLTGTEFSNKTGAQVLVSMIPVAQLKRFKILRSGVINFDMVNIESAAVVGIQGSNNTLVEEYVPIRPEIAQVGYADGSATNANRNKTYCALQWNFTNGAGGNGWAMLTGRTRFMDP